MEAPSSGRSDIDKKYRYMTVSLITPEATAFDIHHELPHQLPTLDLISILF
jgi:hypothetical protein